MLRWGAEGLHCLWLGFGCGACAHALMQDVEYLLEHFAQQMDAMQSSLAGINELIDDTGARTRVPRVATRVAELRPT